MSRNIYSYLWGVSIIPAEVLTLFPMSSSYPLGLPMELPLGVLLPPPSNRRCEIRGFRDMFGRTYKGSEKIIPSKSRCEIRGHRDMFGRIFKGSEIKTGSGIRGPK